MMSDEGITGEIDSLRRQIAEIQSLVTESQSLAPAAGGPKESLMPELPSLLDTGPFGLALFDSDFCLRRVNQTLCLMLGYSGQELTERHLTDITHPQDVSDCAQLVEQVLSGSLAHSRVEKRFMRKSGEIVWFQLTASMIRGSNGDPLCGLAVVEDISARKESEQALRNERELSDRLINNSLDGIFAFDNDTVLTIWNPGMERIFGVLRAEALGKRACDVLPFWRDSGEYKYLLDTLAGIRVIARNRPYLLPETGNQGYFEAYYTPVFEEGVVAGGFAVVRDITEQKRFEEAKRATEERYRELFESAYDMVFTHDLTGMLTSVNKAAESNTGYSREEALGMNLTQLIAPECQALVRQMIGRQVAGEVPATYELDIVSKNGQRVALEVNSRPIFQEGKPVAVQGIARDVTERKKAEAALQLANQKLEAWISELEQRTREMTLLSEMGDMLRACLTTEEAYSVVVRVAQQIFPVQVGALYVIASNRNAVEAVALWGDTSLPERVFTPDECWSLRRGRLHWVENTRTGLLCKHLHAPVPESYLCVPMMAQSEALGILHLTQPENAGISEAKQRLAVAMAEHIAMALSNLKLHETLRSQSIRDPLTALFNRSFLEESLELELGRAARSQRPLGVIMLDIDHFHVFNDTFGREAGDTMIREIGGLLQTSVRKEDICCRFTGPKFAIILPQGNFEVTQARAATLRDQIRKVEVKYRSQLLGRVTASIGVANYPDHGRTVEALLRATDAALRRSKENGGDCIVAAS